MPTIVNVAIRLEKVMELLVQAGFTPDSIDELEADKGGPRATIPSRKNVGGDSEFPAQRHERGLS